MRTPQGHEYDEKTMNTLKAMMPKTAAQGAGREFFEKIIDGLMAADRFDRETKHPLEEFLAGRKDPK